MPPSEMFVFFCLLLLWMAFTPLATCQEQRGTIKFLQKTGKSIMEIWRSLVQIYGQSSLSKTQVRVWFNRFKGGDLRTPTKDAAQPG